jgi:signal transduction histidine kinase
MERLLQFTSHELKTPIAGVRALLQSLQMGAVPEERRFEFMARGLQEVDRLEHLAETILTWQRSVAANDTLTPQRLEAKELVHQVLDHRLKTGVQERIEVNGLDDTAVLADADAFRVIFENLLDNARKYGGGATTVSAQRLGAVWTLTVKDAGAGFPAGDVQLIFDPFRRTKHEGMTHGTGLGLFISRQLAVRMKGDLTAQSDGPGRGAAFTISLPVSEGHRG